MAEASPTVFVVDDDVSVRESLELLIRKHGWHPETFSSAQEFLARPRLLAPSCLVLDFSLPGLNGLELQKLVAVEQPYMPIIFLTGFGDVPMSVKAMKAGAVEFLTKPFSNECLLEAIRHAIERSRVNRKSSDTAAELIGDGWNLVIFPEGGRSPDGWAQPFHAASAGYLGKRTGRPVVPVYLHGTRHVLPKTGEAGARAPGGSGTESRRGGRLRRSPIAVLFGAPMTPDEGENARRFSERIEAAVATLAREVHSDWWQARRAVSAADPVPGAATAHRGPEASAWRRAWALDEPPSRDRRREWPD